ncbi:hypothetical protein ElyMa_003682800 [Elysia marginata]|uniref:Uncharacterized protein n=1 Tax=Elysia marginata TaxID=1093978 RepID=A0AAV4F0M7_9GAST|nr:hypothetical protein ElyMa_003682800 [Elysia marginata]
MRCVVAGFLVTILAVVTTAQAATKCRQGQDCDSTDLFTFWPPFGRTVCCKRSESTYFGHDPKDPSNPDAWICECRPRHLFLSLLGLSLLSPLLFDDDGNTDSDYDDTCTSSDDDDDDDNDDDDNDDDDDDEEEDDSIGGGDSGFMVVCDYQ